MHDWKEKKAEKPADILADLADRQDKLEEQMKVLKNAFPDEDVAGHCRYHEAVIESLAWRRKLMQAIVEKTVLGLVWAAFLWMGTAAIHELQRQWALR